VSTRTADCVRRGGGRGGRGERREGEGRGGRERGGEGGRGEGREGEGREVSSFERTGLCPRGCMVASARTRVFYPQVTS
jgi:hypothetical protein